MEKYFEIFLKYLNILKSTEMGEGDNPVNERLIIVLEDYIQVYIQVEDSLIFH